jgi:SAM-dependent methyltransferase
MIHYNSQYFNWQKKTGIFGGNAELFKFKDYIKYEDKVIDFGCGGGFLLTALECSEKRGIEINEFARKYAENENCLSVVATIDEIENEWADVIISNHALEHTYDPLTIILKLTNKLKKGGLLIIVVPQEYKDKYQENDVNQHLYTWTPLTLGNLVKTCGLEVITSHTLIHKWPPYYEMIYKLTGQSIFNLISFFYCIISRTGYQVKTVGRKK